MAIDWQRPEYASELPRWQLIDDMAEERNLVRHIPDLDVLKGQTAYRDDAGNTTFVPDPLQDGNRDFKDRASFFGATRLTLESLVGVAFERDPQISLPQGMEYLLTNADGSGVDLWQQMQQTVAEVLKKARAGLYVTMPPTDGEASIADQESLRAVATINHIDARRVLNWWTRTDGADTYLAGVVFTDTREVIEDYEVEAQQICRELALDGAGNFFDRAWVKVGEKWVPEDPVYPTDAGGAPLRRIPFLFVGARRNHWAVQVSPMLSIARKNRDHYRNSAIVEEIAWYSGHIQPACDEMDPEAFDIVNKSGFAIGARHLLVAKGFKYAVPPSDVFVLELMKHKAEEMASLGARLIQPGTVAKTAQQDAGEQRAQHSVLSLVSVNVEDAYQWACEQVQAFMGFAGEIEIKMNRAFMEPAVTAEKMRDMRENLLSGLIGPDEAYRILQRAGDLGPDKTLKDYREELAERLAMGSAPETGDLEP